MEGIIAEKKSFNATPFIIALAAAVAALMAGTIFLFVGKTKAESKLVQAQKIMEKMEEDAGRLVKEKEDVLAEKDKLQADTISYVGINTNLTREKEDLDKKLKAAFKIINNKEAAVKDAAGKLKETEKKLAKEKGAENGKLGSLQVEMDKLTAQIKSLEETLRKERGTYHYNLAVAYTQAKLYDEAVDAYKKSLEAFPNNADAYYNLGLLYENFKGDPDAAISCYQKYVELKPDAADRDEVQSWIGRLK